MRSRLRLLALSVSTAAIAVAAASPASAQCSPDPTIANGNTTCSGADNDGIAVRTPNTTLAVAAGAIVSNAGAPAITIEVPNTTSPIQERVTVAGEVRGGNQAGILLLTGPVGTYNGSTTRLIVTVTKDGVVSGTTALGMGRTAGSDYGQLLATIDNAGMITGYSGIALRGDVVTTTNNFTSSSSAFDTIRNQSNGVITGSIVGPAASLTNLGVIDGGTGSALTTGNAGTSYPYTISPGAWTNSGTIRSNSTTATIVSATIGKLTNSGAITNAGSGAALSSPSLVVENQAGGQIGSAGATAVAGGNSLSLVNAGTITGNVTTGASASMVDSSRGRINGSVVFGAGNDTLVVRYGGTPQLITGITGTIDAGGGVNTELLAVNADTTIAMPIALLVGFQQFAIATDKGVTTTLGAGFTAPSTIQLNGAGTLVNRAAIVTPGTAFALNGVSSPDSEKLVNEGSIQTGSSSDYAITTLSGAFSQIVNNGSIDSAGGGVSSFQASIVNAGTITAATTAVNLSGNGFQNTGTIRSTTGVGAILGGNVGTLSTSSGSIQGATAGVRTSGYLNNSGSITATRAGGVAVQLDPYGGIFNKAGGVIGNGGQAITASVFNETVVNAGTINGGVSLTANSGLSLSERYISQSGGVLNGNLVLGSDGLLFTDLVNTGPGQFAGITGTVSAASGAALRYRVTGAQSATIGPVGPFAIATYELTTGASLALTAPGVVTRQLMLAGAGSVDLTANLSATASPALVTVSTIPDQPSAFSQQSALSITSRGTIAVSRALGSTNYAGPGVLLNGADSFTNVGTIAITDRNPTSLAVGIAGGSVTNTGTIQLDGGTGIYGSKVVNTGTITQADGGAVAVGINQATSIDNSGIIRVGGTAVIAYNSGQITNSGTIASTGGIAISGRDTSASATIVNAAGGTISGAGGTAVRLYYGMFTNAGTVTGTTDMGYGYPYYSGAPSRSYASSAYVAVGGTIAGDLLFGDGADVLLQKGETLGISGIIDGGGGTDIYGRSLASSGTVAIDPAGLRNFEDALVQAVGTNTVVTATASGRFRGNLYALGTGSVVNQATIDGALTTTLPFGLTYSYNSIAALFPSDQTLGSLTNAGSVAGGVSGTTASFSNTGSIASSASNASTVSLSGAPNLTFTNSGTISPSGTTSSSFTPTVSLTADTAMTIANSGRIDGGGLSAAFYAFNSPSLRSLDFSNSGTIASTAMAVNLSFSSSGQASVANSGILSAQGAGVTNPAIALYVRGSAVSASVSNSVDGGIVATGTGGAVAYGIVGLNVGFDLVNAGTISATGAAGSAAVSVAGSFNNSVRNTGSIIGNINLAGGSDTVDNAGTILGMVSLGAGDDRFIQRAGGTVSGLIDGGDGADTYIVDASGGSATLAASQIRRFKRVMQTGTGTGIYSGSFGVDTIALGGGTLSIAAGQTLATTGPITITGGDAGVNVVNNGTITGAVLLGAGNDSYTEGAGSVATGGVDGGAGSNLYRVVLAGDRAGIGARTNFQRLSVEGSGMLMLALNQDFQSVAMAGAGLTARLGGFVIGRIDGSAASERVVVDGDVTVVSLGAGNDSLTLGGLIAAGRYDGGDGSDTLRFSAADPVTIIGSVTGFETVTVAGSGLTVAANTSLSVQQMTFDRADARLSLSGGFAGSVANAAAIDISGGSPAAPIAFGSLSGVTALRMSAGLATISGGAAVGSVVLSGGRLIGLAGSSITAPSITVGAGATFGSAGTVTGNVAVAGTLSPGASPGTMTVNGNVALAAGSVAVFEITPALSDKLLVSGTVAIAPGTTLQLVPDQGVKPGQSVELVVAGGGISGSFTNIVKPASLFGVVVQQADRISLLGQFLPDSGFTPQVQRSIAYLNGVLTNGQASPALIAAVPGLVTASGASNQTAFAQLTPEAYASARQITIEHGLELVDVGRSDAFAARRQGAGLFTFGGALGSRRTLDRGRQGASRAKTNDYGFTGGLGWDSETWSVGGFIGYLNSRQNLALGDAVTKADGVVAGLHGRWTANALELKATIAYDSGNATTKRQLPGGKATGDYHLRGWTADLSAAYALPVSDNWLVRPGIGATVIRATRDRVAEAGGSAFALVVDRARGHAVFLDGAMTMIGGVGTGAVIQPYLSIGARYQLTKRTPYALAAIGGGPDGFLAAGASRAPLLATATLGADAILSSRLTIFGSLKGESGNADRRGSVQAGVRLAL